MNVLSLFNGMGCAWLALDEAGIKVNKRYSSEIEKYPNQANDLLYPDTIQLGDVRNVDVSKLEPIDFLCGGSPCQSFSFAGKRKGMSTVDNIEILTLNHYLELKEQNFEFEGQSYLFWEFIRILTEIRKYNPDVNFLLENVIMGSKWQKVITQAIGINPICINSSLVSAQNRNRLYWTNIAAEPDGLFGDLKCTIPQPKDKGILLKDILESEVDEKYFLSDKMLDYFERNNIDCKEKGTGFRFEPNENLETKSKTLVKKEGSQMQNNFIVHNMMPRSGNPKKGGTGHLTRSDGKTYCLDTGNTNAVEVKSGTLRTHNDGKGFREVKSGKAGTIPARAREDGSGQNIVEINKTIRRLTPRECGRLQTVPEDKLELLINSGISDTQLYKMFGNGWTILVIAHIVKYLI
jgi:DNA (cytosine-5)-methyltransferase 3A